jgi:hypothetical protein
MGRAHGTTMMHERSERYVEDPNTEAFLDVDANMPRMHVLAGT